MPLDATPTPQERIVADADHDAIVGRGARLRRRRRARNAALSTVAAAALATALLAALAGRHGTSVSVTAGGRTPLPGALPHPPTVLLRPVECYLGPPGRGATPAAITIATCSRTGTAPAGTPPGLDAPAATVLLPTTAGGIRIVAGPADATGADFDAAGVRSGRSGCSVTLEPGSSGASRVARLIEGRQLFSDGGYADQSIQSQEAVDVAGSVVAVLTFPRTDGRGSITVPSSGTMSCSAATAIVDAVADRSPATPSAPAAPGRLRRVPGGGVVCVAPADPFPSSGPVGSSPATVEAVWEPWLGSASCASTVAFGDKALARALLRAVQQDPAAPTGPTNCPVDEGGAVELVFASAGSPGRVGVVRVSLGGCDLVEGRGLTVGRASPTLLGLLASLDPPPGTGL